MFTHCHIAVVVCPTPHNSQLSEWGLKAHSSFLLQHHNSCCHHKHAHHSLLQNVPIIILLIAYILTLLSHCQSGQPDFKVYWLILHFTSSHHLPPHFLFLSLHFHQFFLLLPL